MGRLEWKVPGVNLATPFRVDLEGETFAEIQAEMIRAYAEAEALPYLVAMQFHSPHFTDVNLSVAWILAMQELHPDDPEKKRLMEESEGAVDVSAF